jgi:broad specificity phosphatase PhoE
VLLGSAEISLAVLGEADPTHVPVRLERGQERCSLLVRLAREPPRTKTIFFVRHGESVWNRAQAKLDVLALVSDVDHPLNLKGRVQAEALQSKMSQLVTLSHAEQPALDALDADAERRAREIVQRGAARRGDDASVSAAAATAAAAAMELERGAVAGALPPKPALPSPRGRSRPPGTTGGPAPLQPDLLTDAERALVNVQMIASSPLTRALQTCVIGLSPLLVRAGCRLRLMSNLREKKNLGGFDSSGSAVGAGVAKRLGETTRFLYQDSPGVASALLACAPIDSGEVADKWWSEIVESKAEVKSRTNELLWQLQFAPEERIALVGHSHFFREVFRHHLSPKFAAANRLLALRLANQKLSNCGVVAVTFDFGARDVAYVTLGEEAAAKLVAASGVIDGVELMLGTTLTGSMKASH